jgi:hypothetical protein
LIQSEDAAHLGWRHVFELHHLQAGAKLEMASSDELTKVRFQLDPNDWHGRPSETLWAEVVSGATVGGAFRLRNSPMFVRGVSFLDIVRGAPRADGEGFELAKMTKETSR